MSRTLGHWYTILPRAPAGPTPDRQAFLNERHTRNLQIVADNGEDEQGSIDSETTDEPSNQVFSTTSQLLAISHEVRSTMVNRIVHILLDDIGVGRSTHDQIGTSELVERLGLILLRSVDVNVSTELLGEILLRVGGRKGDGLETGFGSELDTQMADIWKPQVFRFREKFARCPVRNAYPRPPRPWMATTAPG